MKNEGDVKKAVKKILLKYDERLWYFMPAANGYCRAGVPDFVGNLNGHFFAIETKFGSNDLTANQVKEVQNIVATNGQVWIVRDTSLDVFAHEFAAWAALCS